MKFPLRTAAAVLVPALAVLLSAGASGARQSPEEHPARRQQLSDMKLFNWVILNVKEHYLDQKRINPREMLSATLHFVERMTAEVLVTESADKSAITIQAGSAVKEFPVGDIGTIWEMAFRLKNIFAFIQSNMNSRTDPREIEYMAINGMLSTLDPHSVFLKPELFKEIKTSTKGTFGGLGIQIQAKEGYITVVAPLKDTPAWRAGIKRLDKIVRIDDESTANMSVDEAVNRLRGVPGTKVTVWIMREGAVEPRKFVLVREEIKIVTTESQLLEGGVGYIKLTQFTEQSPGDLLNHYEQLKEKNGTELRGLILDMRDNPGGLLESSIKIGNYFLKAGTIVSTVAQEGAKIEERKAESDDYRIGIPVAVLVNGGSASASEIVAGALKDNNRAIIIGQKTFGKGSVQVLYERAVGGDAPGRENREAGLKLTVAQYLTPADISIQSVGITPDVFLQPMNVQKDRPKLFFRDRPNKEKDLAKHLSDSKAREDKPALTLRYIADEFDPSLGLEEDEEQAEKRETDKEAAGKDDQDREKFNEDFPIRYAKKVIAGSRAPTRQAMIEFAISTAASIVTAEEANLAKVLSNQSLDWTAGPVPKIPAVKSSVRLEGKDGKPINAQNVKAGDTLMLALTVKNTGAEDMFQAAGLIESKEPLFDGREFLMGRLPAGEERTARTRLKIPADYLTGIFEYSIAVYSGHIPTGRPSAGSLVIREAERPRFAASYKIAEDGTGNANGSIEAGETFKISVTLKNVGRGAALKPKISLKNMAGKEIYIKSGRCDLPALQPSKTESCTLPVEVRGEMKEDRFGILLSAFDSVLGEALGQKIVIRLAGTDLQPPEDPGLEAPSPPAGTIEAPTIKVSPLPNTTIVQSAVIPVEGTVTDTAGFKDFYVKVNNKKVYYRSAADNPKEMKFKVNVPLKDGMNVLYLVARKDDELMAVDKYIITRPAGPNTAEN